MNEQQLQQILSFQQALAAATTAVVINNLFNPQQAASSGGANNANALTSTDSAQNIEPLQLQLQLQQLQQLVQLQQQQENRISPTTATTNNAASSSPTPSSQAESNARLQEVLAQLSQQAALGGAASPLALNLNLNAQQQQQQHMAAAAAAALSAAAGLNVASPISSRSPISRMANSAQDCQLSNAATSSNTHSQISAGNNNQGSSPIKKLKKHHHSNTSAQAQQQPFQQHLNRSSSEATSKPQHSTPKNHNSSISNLSRNSTCNTNNTNSSSSSSFLTNNVGLPRKLVRGQDVWLGRGAEQTSKILKCMWCQQSFRTLAEMTQHMKVTMHYTNIISQEQLTSWRQPESLEANSKQQPGNNKQQSAQMRGQDDNQDDFSDRFNDSDREDSFSNDEDSQIDAQINKKPSRSNKSLENTTTRSNSTDNNSTTGSNHGNSPMPTKGSKPLTRSRKRETDTVPIKRERPSGSENSPENSSSSQHQRQNSVLNNNLILSDQNEDSESIKDGHTNGSSRALSASPAQDISATPPIEGNNEVDSVGDPDENQQDGVTKESPSSGGEKQRSPTTREFIKSEHKLKDVTNGDEDEADDIDADEDRDMDEDERASETNESATTDMTTSGAKLAAAAAAAVLVGEVGQKGETGDPLSALETMVEKSFDPRMRPGVANGGILQRLGIDEEVCPPWQHINYANWYAAAAYGYPMAATLLAAGINLQNGIKLSKNVGPKKSED